MKNTPDKHAGDTAPEKEPCGVLLLEKPEGVTSFDCVAAVRRLFATRKVGHCGTLDPLATGVLAVLVGRAAKAAELLLAEEKEYDAVLRLGIVTDTEDITGSILSETAELPTSDRVKAAVRAMQGEQLQIPPMYSALKINGQKLYDLARRGVTVEREPRPVKIYEIRAEQLDPARYALHVRCSKGTYIRTLCADIGAALGCGGVMEALRRTASGNFRIGDAVTLEALDAMTYEERAARLLPVESLFSDLPALTLPPFFERLVRSGQAVALRKLRPGRDYSVGDRVRLQGETSGFFALGEIVESRDGEDVFAAVRSAKLFSI